MDIITSKSQIPTNQQWVVTDNTTLTGAAIVFRELQRASPVLHADSIENWLSFLQGMVLHDVMLADNEIFGSNPIIQEFAENFSGKLTGFDLGKANRSELKTAVRTQCRTMRGSVESFATSIIDTSTKKFHRVYNRTYSELHRGMFYVGAATELGLSYRPSSSRESIFAKTLQPKPWAPDISQTDTAGKLAASLFSTIDESAAEYKQQLDELSGTQLLSAQLPAIAMLVIEYALKTGSWAEAIGALRDSSACQKFRQWACDVITAIANGDKQALTELNETRNFIRGWVNDADEGVYYKTRNVGIGQLSDLFTLPLSFKVADPIINRSQHLIFLNGAFKAAVKPIQFEKLKKIRFQ